MHSHPSACHQLPLRPLWTTPPSPLAGQEVDAMGQKAVIVSSGATHKVASPPFLTLANKQVHQSHCTGPPLYNIAFVEPPPPPQCYRWLKLN